MYFYFCRMATRPDSARSRAAWSAAEHDGDLQVSSYGSGGMYC